MPSIREYVRKEAIDCFFAFMAKIDRYYIDAIFVKKLANRIKEIREQHGHTQEYLIDHVRLSINTYETGGKVPTLMSLLKICKFYNITLDEFFAPLQYPPNR